jgi:DNA-binding transcriptional ArsR family regulator
MSRGSGRAASIGRAVPVFAALGEEKRLALVVRLSTGGPQSIKRLTRGSDVTRQAITKHLHVLAGAGIVRDVRLGREDIWELDSRRLEETRRWLDQVSRRWDEALGRLKAYVEGEG